METKKLGFGLMRLPTKGIIIDKKQFAAMTDKFMEQGFTYFDTAYMYHAFQSESAAKNVIVKRYPRDSFTLATKMPTMMLKTEGMQKSIFEGQLKKCGVEYFDYYLLHSLNKANYATAQKYGTFEYLLNQKQEGRIRKLGFSYHDDAELLEQILTQHPETEFVQLQINYLDWESAGIQSRLCYEVARRFGKQVVVMEPVKGGTLAKVPTEAEKLLKAYNPTASVASWAIRFAADLEGVLTVLSGMSDMAQLEDNISYMKDFQPLNAEEKGIIQQVVKILYAQTIIPCTGCGYCVDGCPKHIPIPKYFSLYNAEKQSENKGFSIHRNYYDNYKAPFGKASDCISCKKCEQICPQHLPVCEYLKAVAKTFGK